MTSFLNNFSRRSRNRTNSSVSSDELVTPPPSSSATHSLSPSLPVPHPSGAGRAGGRDTISDGEYARKCRTLMTLLRDLRNLGANSVFDLPKIVVIGGQSAGKSSLIEAVTGINVPRDSGTCTRCPMECSMSSTATTWMCTISLRSEGNLGVATQRFGPVITNKRDVELWLRRAQGAILSTEVNKLQWESKSAAEIKQAIQDKIGMREFTEDTIVVDIQDQGVTDLSFVDLPGLIQNSDKGSIKLIENLARQNVEGENTLILVTIPANEDIQNQGAVVLAKEADVSGRRTVVVLTKPDTLGEGATGLQDAWKQTLENRNVSNNPNYLQHGYYCVRLPDDKKRQQGYTAHNLPDANYFDVTKPWSEVLDRRRFGVTNLVQDVSALLVQMIEANLPRLRTAIENALKQCIERLGQLPPIPQGEPMANIMLMVNGFVRDIDAASVGEIHKTLAQDCRRRYNRLREDIEATCPVFRFRKGSDGPDVYDIPAVRKVIEDCTGWEIPGTIPYDAYKTFIKRFLEGWDAPVRACFEDIYQLFSDFMENLSSIHFAGYQGLNTFVIQHIRAELQKSKIETEASVLKLLNIEAQPYFSQRSNFIGEQDRWTREYDSTFYPHHNYNYTRDRDVLHVMATVRTYFQFAYERFADTMLLMQEHDLVQSLGRKLETALLNELVHVNKRAGGLKSLLSEDENIAYERRELTNRRLRLLEMRNKLDAYR